MKLPDFARRALARLHPAPQANTAFITVFRRDNVGSVAETVVSAKSLHIAFEPLTWNLNIRLEICNAQGYLFTVCAGTDATLADPNRPPLARRRSWRIERDGRAAVCSANAVSAMYTAAESVKHGPTLILFAEGPGLPWKWCLLAKREHRDPERSDIDGQGGETY